MTSARTRLPGDSGEPGAFLCLPDAQRLTGTMDTSSAEKQNLAILLALGGGTSRGAREPDGMR